MRKLGSGDDFKLYVTKHNSLKIRASVTGLKMIQTKGLVTALIEIPEDAARAITEHTLTYCSLEDFGMQTPPPRDTTFIPAYEVCKDCDFNLIYAPSEKFDNWVYCSNKICKNHAGEQVNDDRCSFIKNIWEEQMNKSGET